MASIRRRGAAWRVELYKDGIRESNTFPTKQKAAAWATAREAELAGKRLPDHTVTDALRRFAREVSPGRKGEKWELARLGTLERSDLGPIRLPAMRSAHVSDWKAKRMTEVSGASVRREMNLMLAVFEAAIEWGWLYANPARGVKKPPHPPSRKRRITTPTLTTWPTGCSVAALPPVFHARESNAAVVGHVSLSIESHVSSPLLTARAPPEP